jgi:hypothetical protein
MTVTEQQELRRHYAGLILAASFSDGNTRITSEPEDRILEASFWAHELVKHLAEDEELEDGKFDTVKMDG